MDKTCLYHEDKLGFDDVRKDLQKGKWIPSQYAQRLAMAVCACRRKIDCQPANNLDIERYKSSIQKKLVSCEEEKEDGSKISPNLRRYITDCLTTTDTLQYSKCRFLEILYNGIYGQFDLLTRAAISSNEPVQTEEKKKKKQYITPEEMQMIIERRRKKKMEVNLVTLPMFSGNTKKLEAHLQASIFEYTRRKGCYVEYDKARNDKSFKGKTNQFFIKVYSSNPVAFKDVRESLIEKAAETQKAENTERVRRRNLRALRNMDHFETYPTGWDTFEDQVMYNPSKDGREKGLEKKLNNSRGRGGKAQTSVLQGGKCLKCLQSFTSLKDSTLCQYHPGYLVNHKDGSLWTCCGQLSEGDVATHDDHHNTGCTEEVQHNWRVHANVDRKGLSVHGKHAKKMSTKQYLSDRWIIV